MPRWPERTIAERFFEFVDDSAGPDECWPWTGAYNKPSRKGRDEHRRPIFRLSSKANARGGLVYANRYVLHMSDGVPLEQRKREGLEGCHTCNNRKCVNPRHLYWGSADDNRNDRYPYRAAIRPLEFTV